MIDAWNVLTHALWIGGAATVLAAWSWLDWRSAGSGGGLRDTLGAALWSPAIALGLALACLGAGLGVTPAWERVLWLLLAGGLAVHGGRSVLRRREVGPR